MWTKAFTSSQASIPNALIESRNHGIPSPILKKGCQRGTPMNAMYVRWNSYSPVVHKKVRSASNSPFRTRRRKSLYARDVMTRGDGIAFCENIKKNEMKWNHRHSKAGETRSIWLIAPQAASSKSERHKMFVTHSLRGKGLMPAAFYRIELATSRRVCAAFLVCNGAQ